MFYNLRENTEALNHILRGWHRAVLRVPVTKYSEEISKVSDNTRVLCDDDNNPVRCKTCGYAIVRIAYADGWEIESCSAVTTRRLVNNKEFEGWVDAVISSQRAKTEVR